MTKEVALCTAYREAKRVVERAGFGDEIVWQSERNIEALDEPGFIREAAWVVLSSGMRESVIRKKFKELCSSFFYFETAHAIASQASKCRDNALEVFGNRRKIDAIIEICCRVSHIGFECVKENLATGGVGYIRSFPFMGPVTCFHLAKNIGLDVMKPDRHLCRIAEAAGYDDPAELCERICVESGDKVSVVDIVLWRYATLDGRYVERFSDCKRASKQQPLRRAA